jgi:hypothetical protein
MSQELTYKEGFYSPNNGLGKLRSCRVYSFQQQTAIIGPHVGRIIVVAVVEDRTDGKLYTVPVEHVRFTTPGNEDKL